MVGPESRFDRTIGYVPAEGLFNAAQLDRTWTQLSTLISGELQKSPEELKEQKTLFHFYFPLLEMVLRVCQEAMAHARSCYVLAEDSVAQNLLCRDCNGWYERLAHNSQQLLEEIYTKINPVRLDFIDEALASHVYSYKIRPFTWNLGTMAQTASWLSMIIDPQNHYGDPHYIYLSKVPEHIPKISLNSKFFSANDFTDFEEGIDFWVTSFDGHLLVPLGAKSQSSEQDTQLWNHLLIAENIYDNPDIDNSVRPIVIKAIFDLLPSGQIKHLDLCGGRGDFIKYIQPRRPSVQSQLIDIADQAVAQAQADGLVAKAGDAERPFQVPPMDVITILFAIQWLEPPAFVNVFEALQPGGCLIANVYPARPEYVTAFHKVLAWAGFGKIETTDVPVGNDEQGNPKFQYIVKAYKPLEPFEGN